MDAQDPSLNAIGMWRIKICCLANGGFSSLILLSKDHFRWRFGFLGQVPLPCSPPPLLQRFYFIFNYIHVHMGSGACGDWKRKLDHLRLGTRATLSCLNWVLGAELCSALQCWVISPAPWLMLFLSCIEIWKQSVKSELSWGMSVILYKVSSNIMCYLWVQNLENNISKVG